MTARLSRQSVRERDGCARRYVPPSPLARDPRRAHHIEHACGEPQQQEHDQPPRRDSKPAVEQPADDRADQHARHQLAWRAGSRAPSPTGRHLGRVPEAGSDGWLARSWSSRSPRRRSLAERAASSGGRSAGIAVARAVGHAFDNPRGCGRSGCPAPLKAARTILRGFWRSQEIGAACASAATTRNLIGVAARGDLVATVPVAG